MQGIRRRLTRLASGWLVIQLATLSAAPAVLCAGMPSGMANVECTCSHGDGVECPMHHATPKRDAKTCSCRSTADEGAAVLASLFGGAAILTTPTGVNHALLRAELLPRSLSHPPALFLVPDAPPPRA